MKAREPRRLARISARIISIVAATLFGLVFLFVVIGSATNYYRILTVLSGSMEPAIPTGALIVSFPYPRDQVRVGDVITFQLPNNSGTLETHRVIKIVESGKRPVVQTKGDANKDPDPWNLRLLSEPAWKTKAVIPGAGYFFEWLRTSFINFLLVIVVPLVLCLVWIWRLWRPAHRHRKSPEPESERKKEAGGHS